MKKIKSILCMIFAVALTGYFFIHISYACRGYNRLMGFYHMKKDSIDVAVIGTSVTFSSFMPMEAWQKYGIASYDYCTNVQFENSLSYSIREVEKTQSPKLYIIDIAPFIFEHFAGNSTWPEQDRALYIKYNIDSMKYSWDRIKLTNEINMDQKGNLKSFLYYMFDLYRYHNNTLSANQWNNSCSDINYGYGYLGKNMGAIIDPNEVVEDNGEEIPLQGCHKDYLERLIETAKSLNGKAVFYCAPILFTEKEQSARKNYIKGIVEEEGFEFWDLTLNRAEIGLDYNTDFWNASHFDSLGAEKITDFLSKKIIESYKVPDRRGDKKYKSWNDNYQAWLVQKNSYNDQDLLTS